MGTGGNLESGDKMLIEEGEGGAAPQEREDSVGDLVNGEVFADSGFGSFPHEGTFRGVQFG